MSFPLGRPLGNPNDRQFQTDVLKAALALLEYPKGPVLEDYPVDAREYSDDPGPLACPVHFSTRKTSDSSADKLLQDLRDELLVMQTWYDQACEKSGRSPSPISGLTMSQVADLFDDFINKKFDQQKSAGHQLSDLLRLGADDLKSYYFKAVSAQPGQSTDGAALADWFWGETIAAACINEVRKTCLDQDSKEMRLVGKLLLIPRNQMHRFASEQ